MSANKPRLSLVILLVNVMLASPLLAEEANDPWETMNRGTFWFNDTFDVYILEPVAQGYDWLLPRPVQKSVANFFDNLDFPSLLVSDLVQLKFDQVALHSGRFLINSSIGIVGLFDVASEMGLEPHYEDFGTALGYWDIGGGPYLVLPFLGPSNVRDGIGRLVDLVLNPAFYFRQYGLSRDEALLASFGATSLEIINTRSSLLKTVEDAKEVSLDYYLFLRSAYGQKRQNDIYDNNPPGSEENFEENSEDYFDESDAEQGEE